jgi:hypothetical protein
MDQDMTREEIELARYDEFAWVETLPTDYDDDM